MTGPARPDTVRRLNELPLTSVRAHGGAGEIAFRRVFDREAFASPCDFADYAALPPGASIGLHRHGASEELYLVIEGRGTMTLDGREFPVAEGDLILNRAGGTHSLVNDGASPLRLFVVQISLGTRTPAAEAGPFATDLPTDPAS